MTEQVLVDTKTLLLALNKYLVIGPVIKRRIFKRLGLVYDQRFDSRYCMSGTDPRDAPYLKSPEEVELTYRGEKDE